MADEEPRAQLVIDPRFGTVEMKLTARARDEDEVLEALERADIEPEAREVYFFDTTDLSLFEAGIVLRVRLVHDGADDSTVKLRPIDPTSIGERWKDDPQLEFEVDAVGDNYVSSAKLSAEQDRGEIDDVVSGERGLRSLFSSDQEHSSTTTPRVALLSTGIAFAFWGPLRCTSGNSSRRSSATR